MRLHSPGRIHHGGPECPGLPLSGFSALLIQAIPEGTRRQCFHVLNFLVDNWRWIDDQTIGDAACDISPDEEFAARITGRRAKPPSRPFDQLSPTPGSPPEGSWVNRR